MFVVGELPTRRSSAHVTLGGLLGVAHMYMIDYEHCLNSSTCPDAVELET